MELFTISLISASNDAIDRLHRCLNEEFVDLHSEDETNGDAVSVAFIPHYDNKEIQCIGELPGFKLTIHGPLVYRKAATAFARYILTDIEPLLLRAIIRKQFNYEDPSEVDMVEQYCRNLLFSGIPSSLEVEGADTDMLQIDRERRQTKVAAELEAFLTSNTRIHLDGFVTFRLASYWEELREVAAFAVDEYMMDKQYQEFISLLKYFVRMQEVKLPIVHVLHRGGSEFALYDEQFELLEAAPADRIVAEMLESEMNMEDMIVSTLITVAPHQIVIHTRHPELPVMRTLETIFENRVQLCIECSRCSFFFNEAKQPVPAAAPKQINAKRIRT